MISSPTIRSTADTDGDLLEMRFDIEEVVEVCTPHAVTTHIKDPEVVDGEVRFRLPGETDFPYEWFFTRLLEEGYRGGIIAEISAQLWRESDFDVWAGAQASYDNLVGPVEAANEAFADAQEESSK
jgi:sugar phosphate isomerase/epimerase